MTDAAAERARRPTGPGFSDAVSFAFADPVQALYGLLRLGLSGAHGARRASALALLFAERRPVATIADGDVPVDEAADFGRLAVGDVQATVDEPLRGWTARFAGADLVFAASGPPATLEAAEPAARAGGTEGYEQLCRVQGTVRVGGTQRRIACLGQRGHSWGAPDWRRMDATRAVGAWFDDGAGIALSAVRPAGADGHAGEATWAALLGDEAGVRVNEARLSTTYDDAGRQRRAGLELWVGEQDAHPRRAAGEVVCGSTLELGQLRFDCAFLRWHMDGRSGAGRYEILRRA